MNQKLQQAIAATRAGQKREAQLLLTQVLQEEPDEVHAWYLLGLLVESPHKQRAYLGKALALDPDHEKARQHLARLQTAAPPIDVEVETLEKETPAEAGEAETAPSATLDVLDDSGVPDWLQEAGGESWIEAAEAGQVEEAEEPEQPEPVPAQSELPPAAVEEPAVKPAQVPETPATKPDSGRNEQRRQEAQLTRLLIGLIAIAVIVFILLLYVAMSAF